MLDNSEAAEEINSVINDWGYTMNATDFCSSRETVRRTATVGGRGRGIAHAPSSQAAIDRIKLAARMNRLQPSAAPIGHLPTTEETLSRDPAEEITAQLRSLGMYSGNGRLCSAHTRRTVSNAEDIHIDGNIPVILDGDLFHKRYQQPPEGDARTTTSPPITPYDPNLPLEEQFTTIPELQNLPKRNVPSKPKPKKPASKPAGQGKKTKWVKLDSVELKEDEPQPRSRYDCGGPIGPGIPVDRYCRSVIGTDGVKYIH